jgi:hypothetical protein
MTVGRELNQTRNEETLSELCISVVITRSQENPNRLNEN